MKHEKSKIIPTVTIYVLRVNSGKNNSKKYALHTSVKNNKSEEKRTRQIPCLLRMQRKLISAPQLIISNFIVFLFSG